MSVFTLNNQLKKNTNRVVVAKNSTKVAIRPNDKPSNTPHIIQSVQQFFPIIYPGLYSYWFVPQSIFPDSNIIPVIGATIISTVIIGNPPIPKKPIRRIRRRKDTDECDPESDEWNVDHKHPCKRCSPSGKIVHVFDYGSDSLVYAKKKHCLGCIEDKNGIEVIFDATPYIMGPCWECVDDARLFVRKDDNECYTCTGEPVEFKPDKEVIDLVSADYQNCAKYCTLENKCPENYRCIINFADSTKSVCKPINECWEYTVRDEIEQGCGEYINDVWTLDPCQECRLTNRGTELYPDFQSECFPNPNLEGCDKEYTSCSTDEEGCTWEYSNGSWVLRSDPCFDINFLCSCLPPSGNPPNGTQVMQQCISLLD